MQCTNQDQYRTIRTHTHRVCVGFWYFDIFTSCTQWPGWLVGWLVRFDICIPILPAMPLPFSTIPICNFLFDRRRRRLKPKKDFTQTERKMSTEWSSHLNCKKKRKKHTASTNKNCTLQRAMQCATRNQTLLQAQKAAKANGKTHMDEFICFVHTYWINIHTELEMESENITEAERNNKMCRMHRIYIYMWCMWP